MYKPRFGFGFDFGSVLYFWFGVHFWKLRKRISGQQITWKINTPFGPVLFPQNRKKSHKIVHLAQTKKRKLQLKAPKTENRNLDLHLENAFSAKQKQTTPHHTTPSHHKKWMKICMR